MKKIRRIHKIKAKVNGKTMNMTASKLAKAMKSGATIKVKGE